MQMYQDCYPANFAAGATAARDDRRRSINVEVIGGGASRFRSVLLGCGCYREQRSVGKSHQAAKHYGQPASHVTI
jgi:hypothetical protein